MTKSQAPPGNPPVEIGWLLIGPFADGHADAIRSAAEDAAHTLADALPEFDWRLPVVERDGRAPEGAVSPVRLLETAEHERDARNWDFVLAITEAELLTFEKPLAAAATSQLLAAAAVSTAHLTNDGKQDTLRQRLADLALEVFGRLNDLTPRPANDGRGNFSAADIDRLRQRLERVADLRVEEEAGERIGGVTFYVRSIAENRAALPQAIRRMRPWAFPLRLSRLTTAAGSALLVLIVTAEAWEMAGSLSGAKILSASLASLAATSFYLLKAQHLLPAGHGALREQRVVRNVGTVLAVVIGMTVTWLAAFLVVTGAGWLLFGDGLLAGWAGDTDWLRAKMAGFAAALAMLIGALGASFEPYGYFRHVTYIDDEL